MKEDNRIPQQKQKKFSLRRTSKESSTSKDSQNATSIKFPFGILLAMLAVAVTSVLLYAVCHHFSYQHWTDTLGDAPSKYSTKTYTAIENLISVSANKDVGIDFRGLRNGLNEIIQYGDLLSEEEKLHQLEGNLQENEEEEATLLGAQPKIQTNYEDGKTILICAIQDGFFNAEVTVVLDQEFGIERNARNYNSLNQYLSDYYNTFELNSFKTTLLYWGIAELIAFLLFVAAIFIYKLIRQKKSDPSSESQNSIADSVPSDEKSSAETFSKITSQL